MSYLTVEVELDQGRVWPRGRARLPAKAHALLTLLETSGDSLPPTEQAELDALVDAEARASGQRAAALLADLQE